MNKEKIKRVITKIVCGIFIIPSVALAVLIYGSAIISGIIVDTLDIFLGMYKPFRYVKLYLSHVGSAIYAVSDIHEKDMFEKKREAKS